MSPIYDWYTTTIYGSALDSAPTGENAIYNIPSVTSITYNAAGTIATVTVANPTIGVAQSFGGAVAGSGTFNDPDFVINSSSNTFTIGSISYPMTPGANYYMRIRAYSGTGQTGQYGAYTYASITPPKPASSGSYTSSTSGTTTPPMSAWELWWRAEHGYDSYNLSNATLDDETGAAAVASSGTSYAVAGDREISTSLFKITNNNTSPTKYSMVTRNSGINTSYSRYAFGTSLFFQSNINDVKGSGGIGFFTNSNGMTGYFVSIQTTASASDSSNKEIRIIKVSNGKQTILNDTQSNPNAKGLTGVLGGIAYKIDINATVASGAVAIDVYINNFKITAIDSSNPLPITSNVAMFSATGKVSFDYFYATPLTEDQYKNGIIQNVYEGKYGTKTLSFLYGDKVVDNSISPLQLPFLDEFGKVAREIKILKIKYEARPGNPLYASTGINKFVNVMGQRLTSFGAEVYLINNAGTFVPLDNSDLYSFSIIGNYIVTTGQHEYVSNTLSENTVAEPVVFESNWIQGESDAKELADWIKSQWSRQQQIVNLETFGNPLISVGDIITINYPTNDFDGTEKLVVTQVNNSFKEGLSTSITARSIYS